MVEAEFRDDAFNYFFDVVGFKVLYLHKVKVSSSWEIKVLSLAGFELEFRVLILDSVSL